MYVPASFVLGRFEALTYRWSAAIKKYSRRLQSPEADMFGMKSNSLNGSLEGTDCKLAKSQGKWARLRERNMTGCWIVGVTP